MPGRIYVTQTDRQAGSTRPPTCAARPLARQPARKNHPSGVPFSAPAPLQKGERGGPTSPNTTQTHRQTGRQTDHGQGNTTRRPAPLPPPRSMSGGCHTRLASEPPPARVWRVGLYVCVLVLERAASGDHALGQPQVLPSGRVYLTRHIRHMMDGHGDGVGDAFGVDMVGSSFLVGRRTRHRSSTWRLCGCIFALRLAAVPVLLRRLEGLLILLLESTPVCRHFLVDLLLESLLHGLLLGHRPLHQVIGMLLGLAQQPQQTRSTVRRRLERRLPRTVIDVVVIQAEPRCECVAGQAVQEAPKQRREGLALRLFSARLLQHLGRQILTHLAHLAPSCVCGRGGLAAVVALPFDVWLARLEAEFGEDHLELVLGDVLDLCGQAVGRHGQGQAVEGGLRLGGLLVCAPPAPSLLVGVGVGGEGGL
mmetsp:Transcript_30661/g.89146  ORF Transcript_30661/g.89146 Transcript_30661/m.89146 type:complete len:422 (-) Transcript_30661:294-1559(-)